MKVIKDTREKRGWSFGIYGCDTIESGLSTGDYSLEGFENTICIERKASSGEIANNLRGVNKERFVNELNRMHKFEASYLICEFTVETLLKFPEGSGIPQKLWYRTNKKGQKVRNIQLNGKYILTFLENKCNQNNIELIFCENKLEAEEVAFNVLKKFYDSKIQG